MKVFVTVCAAFLLVGCATTRVPAKVDLPKPKPAPPVLYTPPPAAPVPAPVYVAPEPVPAPVYVEPTLYTPPPVDENCAAPTETTETDGGYGGTGRAPENCPPAL